MKRRKFLQKAGLSAALVSTAGLAATSCSTAVGLQKGEVLHTVLFDLKHALDSTAANRFLSDGYAILSKLPGVHDFQAFRQCSPKNDFQYGFYMRFATQAAYDTYSAHPEHNRFVEERWATEVTRFQESDFQTLV